MMLHRQILFSLAIAAIAEAILIRTSVEQVPSLHRVAPKYLKPVTFSNFWLFMLISALSPSLSRSNAWPWSLSWNPSTHLAPIFELWRHWPRDASYFTHNWVSYSFPYRSKGPALCPRQVAGIWKAPTLVLAQLSWPDKLKNTRKHLLLFFSFFQINHLCVIVTFIFLYSCKSWTLTAELQRRIQAFEMRSYAFHAKTMLPTRKTVPKSSRQLDHTKTSWPVLRDANCSGMDMSAIHQV